jgi:energy-coupling factor transporter transmembrane protein EcfT
MDGKMNGKCNCMHHKVVPLVIVLIGLAFLLQAFNVLTPMFVAIAWPVLVIIAGLTKLGGRSCKCC